MSPIYSLSATFISNFLTVRSACNAIISPMSFTLSAEIGSANKSPSLRYFPFENFVTNISILTPLFFSLPRVFVFAFFGQQAEVHRTVNGKHLLNRSAEVNGAKPKSLRYTRAKRIVSEKRAEQGNSLLSSKVVSMGVFCDDFAAVDVREGLCYHSRPKKQIQEVHGTGIKPMKESIARRKKRQPIPKRVSGDGSAPPRFRFGFPCCSCLLFRGVCLAAASEASRTCLCQAHATVPNKFFILIFLIFALFLHVKTAPCESGFADG